MNFLRIFFVVFILILLFSCTQKTYQALYPTLSDNRYDSEFPYKNCSKQLNELSKSIKKVSSVVFYEIYAFPNNLEVKKNQMNTGFTTKHAKQVDVFSRSLIGTGIVIYKSINQLALLSCAHVVNFPDTIYNYKSSIDIKEDFVVSFAVKRKVQIYAPELELGKELKILAIDPQKDIVLLGLESDSESITKANVFNYPLGKSKELEWGSFVYIMGFPIAQKMITRGIISNPELVKRGTFLIDAVFNHGFSGAPVLAIKDGVPNFEMVGMVKSSSADYFNYIAPDYDRDQLRQNNSPYPGPFFIKNKEIINYGVTYSITIETLQEFFKKNENELNKQGYYLSGFFEN